jgi:hypothetical protein
MALNLFSGSALPVSVETVIKIVQMLTATGQINNFVSYCSSKDLTLTVPVDTVNALKQFLDDNNVADPMAQSITGLQQGDCQDYKCPHIHNP